MTGEVVRPKSASRRRRVSNETTKRRALSLQDYKPPSEELIKTAHAFGNIIGKLIAVRAAP